MDSKRRTVTRTARIGRLLVPSLCLFCCVAVTGMGCKDEQPVKSPVLKEKPVPAQPVERIVKPDPGSERSSGGPESADPMALPETGELDILAGQIPAGKKRDPFRSFVELRDSAATVRRAPTRPLTPLERYSLDQLRLVGVVGGGSVDKALLEDDVGKGYVVGVGTAVGNQGGKIVSIRPDRIVIQETVTDPLGEERARNIVKRLYVVD